MYRTPDPSPLLAAALALLNAGEPEHVWWLGFDCAHSGDYCPAHSRLDFNFDHETYKDVAYVQRECERLSAQLAKVAT